jgi:hypothetical protein
LPSRNAGQLSEPLRQAVHGNTASFIALRICAEDAPLIAAHLGLEPYVETFGLGLHQTPPLRVAMRNGISVCPSAGAR